MKKSIIILITVCWSATICFGETEPVRIMPLGDSITFGYANVLSTYNSYRKNLKALLDANGYSTDFVGSLANGDFTDNQHEGHNGWFADDATSPDTIVGNVGGWLASTPADIVLLHIGSNDVHHNDADSDEVSDILDEIYVANSDAVVILALIINAHTAYGKRTEISTYNTNLNTMAQNRILNGDALLVVDMENGAGLNYSDDLIYNNLHPYQIGYDKMATNWYPAIVEAIELHLANTAPVISSITKTGTSISITVDNLTTGCLTHVERTFSLSNPAWSNQWSLSPSTTETNWIDPQVSTSAFYRVVIP